MQRYLPSFILCALVVLRRREVVKNAAPLHGTVVWKMVGLRAFRLEVSVYLELRCLPKVEVVEPGAQAVPAWTPRPT